jgi:hypothetical protein
VNGEDGSPAHADQYYLYLLEGVTKIRSIAGSLGVEIMRRNEAGAVAYVVISYREAREAIKAYAGQDIEKPRHLPKDRELLLELPTRVLHYDLLYKRVVIGLRICSGDYSGSELSRNKQSP